MKGWARGAERLPAEAAEPRLKIQVDPARRTRFVDPASTWAILVIPPSSMSQILVTQALFDPKK
jgi:hypothetical protein